MVAIGVSLLSLVLVAFVPAAPAAAAPATSTAPPGNSAIDEYVETVPGVGGNVRPRPPGEDGGTLTPAQTAELENRGSEGQTLARVVEATAPPARPSSSAPERTSPAAPTQAAGDSPVSAALAATTGTDDRSALGLLLPAIMIASLVSVVLLARSRRRRT